MTDPNYEAGWRALSEPLSWMQDNPRLKGYWGWNLADIANDLIDRAYPGLRNASPPVEGLTSGEGIARAAAAMREEWLRRASDHPGDFFEAMAQVALAAFPKATATVEDAAINQNDRMRQELAHIGNLVSDLERAMHADPANPDGSWPDLAGRIERLKAKAKATATASVREEQA